MLSRSRVTVELSDEEGAAVSAALGSAAVEPHPRYFEALRRMRRGDPVERRAAVAVADALGRSLADGMEAEKRSALRTIEGALR